MTLSRRRFLKLMSSGAAALGMRMPLDFFSNYAKYINKFKGSGISKEEIGDIISGLDQVMSVDQYKKRLLGKLIPHAREGIIKAKAIGDRDEVRRHIVDLHHYQRQLHIMAEPDAVYGAILDDMQNDENFFKKWFSTSINDIDGLTGRHSIPRLINNAVSNMGADNFINTILDQLDSIDEFSCVLGDMASTVPTLSKFLRTKGLDAGTIESLRFNPAENAREMGKLFRDIGAEPRHVKQLERERDEFLERKRSQQQPEEQEKTSKKDELPLTTTRRYPVGQYPSRRGGVGRMDQPFPPPVEHIERIASLIEEDII